MTTPSGDQYQYGEDTVAARLEVDIPQEAINHLGDINRLTADIRANMEATAKYNGDYIEYLRELPNVIGEVDEAQARMSEGQSSIFGGGDMSPRRDPFSSSGRGTDATATFSDSMPGAGRDYTKETLVNLARENPRQAANMAADRGMDQYFDDDQSRVVPRPEGGFANQPGAGRGSQFSGASRPPSAPSSPRYGTHPGDDGGRSASETPGRQVTPEGTESSAERAANRLLAELEKRDSDAPDTGGRIRGMGESFQNSPFLNYLTSEGGTRGRGNALDFAGGIGSMTQRAGEDFLEKQEKAEEERSNLLSTAANVAQVNPEMAAKLRERAAGMSGKLGGMSRIAPLAKGAGVAGAAIAGVAAINAGVQKGGEWAHNMQGQGVQVGGGFSEGVGFEAQIRTMAMNPFISTEQSRKIMQEALQSGYTGKEMDTMTEFMAENLKQMNLEAAESMKLLRQNVMGGGQSVESLQGQLSGNVALARDSNLTTDQINQQYTQVSGQAVNAGGGGAEGGAYAQNLIATFGDDPILGASGATDLANAAFNNPVQQQAIAAELGIQGEVLAGDTASYVLDQEGGPAKLARAQRSVIKKRLMNNATQYAAGATPMAKSQAVGIATIVLKQMGYNWDKNTVANVLAAIADGTWDEQTESGIEEAQQVSGGDMEVTSTDNNFMSMIGSRVTGATMSTFNSMIGNEEGVERAGKHFEDSRKYGNQWLAGGETYVPEVLTQLAGDHYNDNARDVEFINDSGEAEKLGDRITDEAFMKRVQSGDVKLRVPGQEEATTLGEYGNAQQSDIAAGSGNMFGIQVDLTDEAKRLLNITVNGPNPTQANADRGVGTRNSREAEAEGSFGTQGGG